MVTAVSYMCDQHLRTEINIAKSTVDRRSFATVGYLTRCCISTSATWFERIISARTFYMASLPVKDAEEDHGDAGLTTSSNGLEYPRRVCSARKGQKRVVSVSVTSDPLS